MSSNVVEGFKGNILIVDDMPNNLRLLSAMLKTQNYDVRSAITGALALKSIQVLPPDLILLDINMPQMDGFEVCQKLKAEEETRHIPIIFVSALSDVFDKVKAFELGAADYITKPFQLEEVVARVETQINSLRLQEQLQESEAQEKAKSQQLAQTLQQLQKAQSHLIVSEKMSSLGQLVVSIANELNNPINFIYGNLSHARSYAQSLLKLLTMYQEALPETTAAIAQEIEAIDLDFLKSDLLQLLTSMDIGAERIYGLVQSLRNFSSFGMTDFKLVDIHEGLDSCLTLLQHRLKAKVGEPIIKVVKEYGDLPLIECYLGEINQVFMVIITNAVNVLDEQRRKKENREPKITIHTVVIYNNYLTLSIMDNGFGITEVDPDYLFDNLFNTPGVDTEKYLAIACSYHIIKEKHQGQLKCISHVNRGTEFIIKLPMKTGRRG
ncbi:MAG: hybrid sensor histidine kinase/response regulator [Spirulinaceae cyanobacterium]